MTDPEHEDYDDDEYKYYPDGGEWSKNSFKFDWSVWEKWLKDVIDDIIEENDNTWVVKPKQSEKFPVSDSTPKDVDNSQLFAYLGSNHYQEGVWKTKYFIKDEINELWNKHIQANAVHFLKQPRYYKGLFDILN